MSFAPRLLTGTGWGITDLNQTAFTQPDVNGLYDTVPGASQRMGLPVVEQPRDEFRMVERTVLEHYVGGGQSSRKETMRLIEDFDPSDVRPDTIEPAAKVSNEMPVIQRGVDGQVHRIPITKQDDATTTWTFKQEPKPADAKSRRIEISLKKEEDGTCSWRAIRRDTGHSVLKENRKRLFKIVDDNTLLIKPDQSYRDGASDIEQGHFQPPCVVIKEGDELLVCYVTLVEYNAFYLGKVPLDEKIAYMRASIEIERDRKVAADDVSEPAKDEPAPTKDVADVAAGAENAIARPGDNSMKALVATLNYFSVNTTQQDVYSNAFTSAYALVEAGVTLDKVPGLIDAFKLDENPGDLSLALEVLEKYGDSFEGELAMEALSEGSIGLYPVLKELRDQGVASAEDRAQLREIFGLDDGSIETMDAVEFYDAVDGNLNSGDVKEARSLGDIYYAVWLRNFRDKSLSGIRDLFIGALMMADAISEGESKDNVIDAIVVCASRWAKMDDNIKGIVEAQLNGVADGSIEMGSVFSMTLKGLASIKSA